MKIQDFRRAKEEGRKLSMVTAYDYTMARIVNASAVDCVLVGDSAAMVMHGHPSTLQATTELMRLHTRAVARGAPDKFVVADMPFLSFRKGLAPAMDCVQALMQAGACAVKLEGLIGHEATLEHIIRSDVPVMGHLGLTPQSVHKLGGYRVQGRDSASARALKEQAARLEELGCFALVLECVPEELAGEVSAELSIPVIGIGSGRRTDGQVLVLQDLLGMTHDLAPKFVKRYLEGCSLMKDALDRFDAEIKNGGFPEDPAKHHRVAKA
ncbi:MAG TPA: 3-methyl-2-oxobutanoate hydroxymethyltransferase [Elusimicrobia bacterium]|nr:3-methyl-2-oxobutanoate hydroxymethyltransferase [Elusimicrobiota bacterium]